MKQEYASCSLWTDQLTSKISYYECVDGPLYNYTRLIIIITTHHLYGHRKLGDPSTKQRVHLWNSQMINLSVFICRLIVRPVFSSFKFFQTDHRPDLLLKTYFEVLVVGCLVWQVVPGVQEEAQEV